jgi:hypothetical protein
MQSDANLIFEKYKHINENLGLGPNGASTVNIKVGHTTKHAPRRQPGGTTFSAFSSDEECECDNDNKVYIQAGDTSSQSDESEDYDDEIDMARAELLKAADYATKLFNHLATLDNLEGWTASKITKASDYLSSVYHHLEYESFKR